MTAFVKIIFRPLVGGLYAALLLPDGAWLVAAPYLPRKRLMTLLVMRERA